MTRDWFLALNNLALKVVCVKNYSKVGTISKVHNEVAVETWMAKRSIADYINASLHGFAYYIIHTSFKRPFFVGKNFDHLFDFKSLILLLFSKFFCCLIDLSRLVFGSIET